MAKVDKHGRDEDDICYNMLVFSQVLLGQFDDLEDLGVRVYKQNLKRTGNQFKRELDKYCDGIYNNLKKQGTLKGALYPTDNMNTILNALSHLTVQERKLFADHIDELVAKIKLGIKTRKGIRVIVNE